MITAASRCASDMEARDFQKTKGFPNVDRFVTGPTTTPYFHFEGGLDRLSVLTKLDPTLFEALILPTNWVELYPQQNSFSSTKADLGCVRRKEQTFSSNS